jgi:hypothetical protein
MRFLARQFVLPVMPTVETDLVSLFYSTAKCSTTYLNSIPKSSAMAVHGERDHSRVYERLYRGVEDKAFWHIRSYCRRSRRQQPPLVFLNFRTVALVTYQCHEAERSGCTLR